MHKKNQSEPFLLPNWNKYVQKWPKCKTSPDFWTLRLQLWKLNIWNFTVLSCIFVYITWEHMNPLSTNIQMITWSIRVLLIRSLSIYHTIDIIATYDSGNILIQWCIDAQRYNAFDRNFSLRSSFLDFIEWSSHS